MQEDVHHDEDQHDGFDQRLDHVLDRQLHELGCVVGDGIFYAGREGGFQLIEEGLDLVGGLKRIGAVRERNLNAGGLVPVHASQAAVALRAELDPRHIAQRDGRAARIVLNDDLLELRHGRQLRLGRDCGIQRDFPVCDGIGADRACGDLGVLRLDRRDHISGRQAIGSEFICIEPDAHSVGRAKNPSVADAVHAGHWVLHMRCDPVADIVAA